MKREEYTSIDLFSGPGGLCTGFKWAGIKPLIAVEWSDWTIKTYATSHGADVLDLELYLNRDFDSEYNSYFEKSDKTLLIHGDINKVNSDLIMKILNNRFGVSSVDIVTGGAPCESFSMAGDRKEDDERNSLYKNILRIAKIVDSKMFLFENVKGLFSKKYNGKKGEMYTRICDEFQSKEEGMPSFKLASIDKSKVLLKAIDYGVPQSRERVFLIGLNSGLNLEFLYPMKTHGAEGEYNIITVQDAILDLPKIEKGEEEHNYNFDLSTVEDESRLEFLKFMRGVHDVELINIKEEKEGISSHKAPNHKEKMFERIKNIKQGESMKSAYERLISEGKEKLVSDVFPKKIYAARNRRLKLTEPSFTVTSHCLDEMIHPIQDRALTPREAARLQSFPDWYQFIGPYVKFHSDPEQDQYEQIGDAIPPLLAYALGKEVVNTLKKIENK